MERINVGLTAKNFYLWDGGIDFIATIAQGLEYDDFVSTFLLLKKDSFFLKLGIVIRIIFKSKLSLSQIRADVRKYNNRYERLKSVFRECTPNTKILWYRGSYFNDDRSIMKCLHNNKIDILIAHNGYFRGKTLVPWIGYMYDFQHEYLSELFDKCDIRERRKELKKRIKNSRYIIVNAQDVEKDIRKFYPDYENIIFSLPFAPFQKPDISKDKDLHKYNLPSQYYMISNQFWKHKNHLVAFEALEKLYNEGHKNIHIVCTGKIEDSRDLSYTEHLFEKIEKMNCKKNIHLLGYIPKSDQIAIMGNAVGLIQPTLCEGGPGGGAVYNALCLGITCLVSDIKVNREIAGYENVYFFGPNNIKELALLMLEHYNDPHLPDEIVNHKIEENKKHYSSCIVDFVRKVIQKDSGRAI